MNLNGNTIINTGGTSGICLRLTEQFPALGSKVLVRHSAYPEPRPLRTRRSQTLKLQAANLDNFGIQKLEAQDRLTLLEILEGRWGRASTTVVSEGPIDQWFETRGEPTIADAICDRMFSNAERIALTVASLVAPLGLRQDIPVATLRCEGIRTGARPFRDKVLV